MNIVICLALALAATPAFAAAVVVIGALGQSLWILIGWALLLTVGWWVLHSMRPAEPFFTVLKWLLIIVTAVVVVNFIAAIFFGGPFITFR